MFHWTFWLAYWFGRGLDVIIFICLVILVIVLIKFFTYKEKP
ncbi:hypothetical protein ES703_38569 [subsurface metagenome]